MLPNISEPLIAILSANLRLSKSRLETLVKLILLLINVGTVNLTHIAAQFSNTAKPSSSYRSFATLLPVCSPGCRGIAFENGS